jgi:ABC-2 type transport system ATP-binding protein
VLPSVSLELPVRPVIGLLGPIGSGKTTLMRAIAGVQVIEGGEVEVQRSRVSLATALVGSPDVLVLDEPTVGLDPVLRRDVWSTFHRLAEDGGTLLVSSHVMDEAERCDELVLLREGRVVATGAPDALRERTGEDDLENAFLKLAEAEVP